MATQIDRWGRVVITPDEAFELAYNGRDIWSLALADDERIRTTNQIFDYFGKSELKFENLHDLPYNPDEEHARRSATWLISDEIRSIPVRDFLISMCKTDEERARVQHEMDLYEARNLIPLLQLMMYLVDHFRRNNVVWGVGRGSSVASYCLYLIGVHKIDSIKYGLDVDEFLK